VVEKEDKQEYLGTDQFGYASVHYRVKQPDGWNTVPSFAGTGVFQAEIQVRTLAQHIWAAASHVLQYKNEESVPRSVLRSINRVAALLETADLEFERALDLRAEYIKQATKQEADSQLNVDLVARILDEELPGQNKSDDELYAELLNELHFAKICTGDKLRSLIRKRIVASLKEEAEIVATRVKSKSSVGTTPERIARGVYFTHVGLTRRMLRAEFGDDFFQKVDMKSNP
jgi:ppGpp synthetase/RelA/SpoT-type nucleotidyltranferase